MNPINGGFVVLALFWAGFGSAFLAGSARWRFLAVVLLWQLFTPMWPLWLDSALLVSSFTLFEMAYRALHLTVRNRGQQGAGSAHLPDTKKASANEADVIAAGSSGQPDPT